MALTDRALLLVICLAWAGNFLAAATALQHFPPLLFTALRMAVVLLCLLPWLKALPAAMRWRVVQVAILNGVLHFGLNFWALRLAGDISSTAIALQIYIPLTALLAWWIYGERIGLRTAIGITVAFAGVLLLGFDPLVLDAPAALLLCLLSAITLALGTVLLRGISGINTFQLQAWSAAIALPILLASSALFETWDAQLLQQARLADWGGVLYSGLVASLVGHGLLFMLIQRHPVATVTPWLLLTPVFAVVLGVLVWGDQPGLRLLIGGAGVLVGVLVVATRSVRTTTPLIAKEP
jgi:O-acetylserine/cysteine efflux transporter